MSILRLVMFSIIMVVFSLNLILGPIVLGAPAVVIMIILGYVGAALLFNTLNVLKMIEEI